MTREDDVKTFIEHIYVLFENVRRSKYSVPGIFAWVVELGVLCKSSSPDSNLFGIPDRASWNHHMSFRPSLYRVHFRNYQVKFIISNSSFIMLDGYSIFIY